MPDRRGALEDERGTGMVDDTAAGFSGGIGAHGDAIQIDPAVVRDAAAKERPAIDDMEPVEKAIDPWFGRREFPQLDRHATGSRWIGGRSPWAMRWTQNVNRFDDIPGLKEGHIDRTLIDARSSPVQRGLRRRATRGMAR